MESGTGTYVLLFRLKEVVRNRFGEFVGDYCYVGSAFGPGGFEARIRRHLRRSKTLRWHIDLLTTTPTFEAQALFLTRRRAECEIARSLSGILVGHPGFGSSDCRCPTHLFRVKDVGSLGERLRSIGLRQVGLDPLRSEG